MTYEDKIGTTNDLKSDFDGYLPTYQDTIQELCQLFPNMGNVREVFDAGCGLGASILALARTLPRSQIWAVSVGEEPLELVRREMGKRLHFESKKIIDFLHQTNKSFGLVFMARVPFSGITTENDYRVLRSRVKNGGYVLMLGDTRLDDVSMTSVGFKKLDLPSDSIAATYTRLAPK